MMHMFPDLFAKNRVAPVENYPEQSAARRWKASRPSGLDREPTIARADARHLQQRLLRALVPRRPDGRRAGRGPGPRRRRRRAADEDDAGPAARSTSSTGASTTTSSIRSSSSRIRCSACRACSIVYRAGRVTIVNAPGAGIADDKAIYSYIPEIIEFYTGRAPILQNVPTYNCRKPDDLAYVLEHLPELVVKEVHGSGGYGMLVGPDRDEGRDRSVPRKLEGASRQLHRAADAGAVHLPDAGRDGRRPAASRPAAVRAGRRRGAARCRAA